MKIEIEEKFCIRLGQFAAENGLTSFSAAIARLLSNRQDAPKPRHGNDNSPVITSVIPHEVISWELYKSFLKREMKTSGPVHGYPNALNHLARTHKVNVWPMESIEEVRQVYRRFREGGDLREANSRYNNGQMSAAVGKFIALLKSLDR